MKTIASARAAQAWADRIRAAGLSLGLVPTMGALHEGHRSLFRRAREECDRVAVSLFVNPTQFGPREDLARYPRTPEEDLAACAGEGVDLVLTPPAQGPEGIYPAGFQSWVEVVDLAAPFEGARRPGHFRGVATVVAILLNLFRPDRVYFGQKDFQQARLIARMVEDLRLPGEVVALPTVRDADGVALSSRNRYLSPGERESARAIPRALRAAEALHRSGERRGFALRRAAEEELAREPGLRLDYLAVADAASLGPLPDDRVDRGPEGAVLLVAAFAGSTRLIDNLWIRRE